MKRPKTSAGLLMFRQVAGQIEVLLAHPGGPYFRGKDDGVWTIPKGEAAEAEDLLGRAQIEFEEEVGFAPASAEWISLGTITQKGGKVVHGWAFAADLPAQFAHQSNTFELEWPPRSGRTQTFPEVDRVEFFSLAEARRKLKPAQTPFLDRLVAAMEETAP